MKLLNGNTLMADESFNGIVKSVRGRFDSYQSAAEYAVYHFCEHGDKTKLERLMRGFVGASGRIIGDGVKLAAYVNRYAYGFTIKADASVVIDKKKNGKSKPRGFKAYNANGDLSWKEGGHVHGFADSLTAWMKAEEERKREKQAEREEKQALAEALAAEAKQAEAEAKQAEASGEDGSAPDYHRATDVAGALRDIMRAMEESATADVDALAEALTEAKTLSRLLESKLAEAEAPPEEANQAEAEAEAEAEANQA